MDIESLTFIKLIKTVTVSSKYQFWDILNDAVLELLKLM